MIAAVTDDPAVRFVPSAVEGREDVREVIITPTRVELRGDAGWTRHEFASFARGARVPGAAPLVGERDYFRPPARRFFRFYTTPSLTIYMPDEPDGATFSAIRSTIHAGAYWTFDLG